MSSTSGRMPERSRRAEPITIDRIVTIALSIVRAEGFDALTMRRVASALDTGPASLYVHVRNKAALDDLLLGALSSQVALPAPDPARWRAQLLDVAGQLRDQYLGHPGIARAAMAVVPTAPQTLRLNEGMLGILLAGGFAPQVAAWATDAIALHVAAYALERSIAAQQSAEELAWLSDPAAVAAHLAELPAEEFPLIRRHAAVLTAGEGHARLDFALGIMLDGLPRGGR